MKKMVSILGVLSVILLVGFLASCGGGSGSSDSGTVQVAITDAAAEDFAEITIAIKSIDLVPADCEEEGDCEVETLASFEPARTVDVISLAYQQEVLGEHILPEGSYNQVRLVLEANVEGQEPANYLVLAGTVEKIPIKTPSGQESGLKILGKVTVVGGEITAIALDFDPAKAIVEAGSSGNWIFKPTGIRVVQMDDILAVYGALAGMVGPEGAWPTAVVSVYPEGESGAIASGLVNSEDGTYRAFVPAGSYHLQVAAEGYDPYDSSLAGAVPAGPFEVTEQNDTPVTDIVLEPVVIP